MPLPFCSPDFFLPLPRRLVVRGFFFSPSLDGGFELLERERGELRPLGRSFDGYVEKTVRVRSPDLIWSPELQNADFHIYHSALLWIPALRYACPGSTFMSQSFCILV